MRFGLRYWLPIVVFLTFRPVPDILASINIALHAQVYPDNTTNKIVGSVITTDGIQKAFLRRHFVSDVKIFYPGHYHGYVNSSVAWDLLLIEGWFPSIHDLIHISRVTFPSIVVIYYCLDPTYPGMDVVTALDVDGVLTNSHRLQVELQRTGIPTEFVMLAADPEVMRPDHFVARQYGAVYVGAGAGMLTMKPTLKQMLIDALPYGLLLHGTGWNDVDRLKDVWQGPLPRQNLSRAYSSAEAVLASTVQSQDSYGMVNNRIFEALASGSIVVTESSPALKEVFSDDLIKYFSSSQQFRAIMDDIVSKNQTNNQRRRVAARQFILQQHTWDHRAVQIDSFFTYLQSAHNQFLPTKSNRMRRPLLAWVTSNYFVESDHFDYTMMVNNHFREFLSTHFEIELFSYTQWMQHVNVTCLRGDKKCMNWLQQFDAILAICRPWDDLDNAMRLLPHPVTLKGAIQRRSAYIIGVDTSLLARCLDSFATATNRADDTKDLCMSFDHYDAVFYRDSFDLSLLKQLGVELDGLRIQHAFAVPNITEASDPSDPTVDDYVLSICFIDSLQECSIQQRKQLLHGDISMEHLVLIGGEWVQWTNFCQSAPSSFSAGGCTLVSRGEDGIVLFPNHTTHYRSGQPHVDLVHKIKSATAVYLFYEALSGANTSSDLVDTVQHVVFPLVASGLLRRTVKIPHFNEHVVHVAQSDASLWDTEKYLKAAVSRGIHRLMGFPPARSGAYLEVLPVKMVTGTSVSCADCGLDDQVFLATSGLADSLPKLQGSFALLKVHSQNFLPGRDGQFCINQLNRPEEDSMCTLRWMPYLVIASDSVDLQAFRVTSWIRGNMLGDAFRLRNHTVAAVSNDGSSDAMTPQNLPRGLTFEAAETTLIYRYF